MRSRAAIGTHSVKNSQRITLQLSHPALAARLNQDAEEVEEAAACDQRLSVIHGIKHENAPNWLMLQLTAVLELRNGYNYIALADCADRYIPGRYRYGDGDGDAVGADQVKAEGGDVDPEEGGDGLNGGVRVTAHECAALVRGPGRRRRTFSEVRVPLFRNNANVLRNKRGIESIGREQRTAHASYLQECDVAGPRTIPPGVVA
ncbi:hypothetical protein GGX14DRAFT_397175 [Mycena pura]|uniref:Uncharacterized protein n=1 Tax=Mycena pura TaxID=153505 RepID=A0AAD6Y931_9AGAR|nr:hypothetical protein GGX14DRAFT_397175 [Mycena pura]